MSRVTGIAVAVGLLLIYGWWTFAGGRKLHVPIDPAIVTEVTVWGEAVGQGGRPATAEEREQVIRWYNAGSHPRDNSALAGTTPQAGIRIRFAGGGRLSISRSGTDFEVQDFREEKPRYYWLKQADLRRFLDELAGR